MKRIKLHQINGQTRCVYEGFLFSFFLVFRKEELKVKQIKVFYLDLRMTEFNLPFGCSDIPFLKILLSQYDL